MIIVVLGGPGTGKGTRSKVLSEALSIPHISTGELLRKVAQTNPDVQEMLDNNELVSDDMISEHLYDRLFYEDCLGGFIIDGYPRTLNQAILLDNMLKKLDRQIDFVFELSVPDEIVIRRIVGRQECKSCGKIYGTAFPSKVENVCDDCGGELLTRSTDTREKTLERIVQHNENIGPIRSYYDSQRLLEIIDATTAPETIIEDLKHLSISKLICER